MIDLHCHSHYSDGALSPKELLQKALAQQITCLSLTDHDTIAGYPELHEAALNKPIRIIQGIEFSTLWKKYEIHLLGYQFVPNEAFYELIERQNTARIERAQKIGAALGLSGVKEAYDKACEIAGHKRVGRPHFACVLVNEGKTRDMQSAFKQFLGRGKSAYVPTSWVSLEEAVSVINQAGGQAVIAHPLKYGLTRTKLHELIKDFKDAGGIGIEVVSGGMTLLQIREMALASQRFNLRASSGSDYHSDIVSYMNLGRQQQLPVQCTPIWQHWNI